MKYLQYYLPFSLLVISLTDLYYFKKYYLFMAVIFFVVPIMEYLPKSIYKLVLSINTPFNKNDFMHKMILYIWMFMHYIYYGAVLYYIKNYPTYIKELMFNVISVGFLNGGFGTTVAHELFHKTKIDRLLSYSLLLLINYPHFQYIHNKKHHVNVATDLDYSSAKLGENFYKMFVRSVVYNYLTVLIDYPFFFIWLHIVQLTFCYLIYIVFGFNIVLFHIGQSFFSILTIEIANYIQHYGLRRKIIGKDKNGNTKYEPVKKYHSWDYYGVITNAISWGLPNHSDHHTSPTKDFQKLEQKQDTLEMPYPYSVMYVLALIPPLWFKVVDKIVIKHNKKIDLKTL